MCISFRSMRFAAYRFILLTSPMTLYYNLIKLYIIICGIYGLRPVFLERRVFFLRIASWSWIKNKTAKDYLLSYIRIGIIPVIVVCITACIGIAIPLKRQMEESRMSQLEQIKNELDGNITFMENSSLHLSGLLSADHTRMNLGQDTLIQQLNAYRDNMKFPCEILYYPRGEGSSIYTADGKTDYVSFQKRGKWNNQLDMIQFYKKLMRVSQRMFLTTQNINTRMDGDYLVYLSPVPNLNIAPVGTLAFLVNREFFDNTVQNYCGDFKGYFLMLDTFYGLSYNYDQCRKYDPDYVLKALTLPHQTNDGIIHQKIGNDKFVLLKSVSKNYGFTYLFAIPEKVLYQPVYDTIKIIVLLSTLFLALLSGAAFLTTRKRYQPLRQLAGDMVKEHGIEQADLLEEIRNQFSHIENQNRTLQTQIQAQFSLRRQRVLTELLFGWYKNKGQLKASLEQVGISFPHRHFYVMVARMEEEKDPGEWIYKALEQTHTGARTPLWQAFLINTNVPHTVAILINLKENPEEKEDCVLKIARDISQGVRNISSSSVKIGIGGLRDDYANINHSYCEALVAMTESPSPIAFFHKPDESSENLLCPPTEGKMLQQSLLNGSKNTATGIVEQIIQAIGKRHLPLHMERCYRFYLVILILQIQPFLEKPLPEEELIEAANHAEPDRFSAVMKACVNKICKEVIETRQNAERKDAEALMDYIHQHFGEYTLSAEVLAKHFNIPEKKVRQILKDQTRTGLSNYLTNLRMEKVKQQLVETDLPIKEIILCVGYMDVSSFIRKFKKMEGITPGQYRELIQSMPCR